MLRPQCPPCPGSVRSHGFTLLELLLAATLSAVLMTAASAGLSMFSAATSIARAETDTRLDETATHMLGAVRDAWWADVPGANELVVSDPFGALTSFEFDDGALSVTRPSGATGVLLDGVAQVTFEAQGQQRFRDDAPVTVAGSWFTAGEPLGTPVELSLEAGDGLALGFSMTHGAPDSVDTVDGVAEQRLSASMDQLTIAVSFLDGDQHIFCHLHASPPHNPTHPGYLGGKLFVDLHEARAPDDALPYGPSLGRLEVPAAALPPTPFVWWDTIKNKEANHVPNGTAWGWWGLHPEVELVLTPTTAFTTIDLSGFGQIVEPGRAYALVLTVEGWDNINVRVVPTLSADFSGVAVASGGGSFVPAALAVGRSLAGAQTCTQTAEQELTRTVAVTIVMDDGRQLKSSAAVSGQVAVPEPWHGVVPGETPVAWLADPSLDLP